MDSNDISVPSNEPSNDNNSASDNQTLIEPNKSSNTTTGSNVYHNISSIEQLPANESDTIDNEDSNSCETPNVIESTTQPPSTITTTPGAASDTSSETVADTHCLSPSENNTVPVMDNEDTDNNDFFQPDFNANPQQPIESNSMAMPYTSMNPNPYSFNSRDNNLYSSVTSNDNFFFSGPLQQDSVNGHVPSHSSIYNGNNTSHQQHFSSNLHSLHNINLNGSSHYYSNNTNYYGSHIPSHRSTTPMNAVNSHRHPSHLLGGHHFTSNNSQTIPPPPPHASPSNPYYSNPADHSYSVNGSSYGFEHQFTLNGGRPISPRFSSANRNHMPPLHSNMIRFGNHNNVSGGARYNQMVHNSILNGSADVITPEMLSVANTTTISAFGNENVCTQINNILSQSTKDHQAIVIATKSSSNSFLHDSNGMVHHNGVHNGFAENDDVHEILRATGFDSTSQNRISQSSNYHNFHGNTYHGGVNNNTSSVAERFNSYPRRSQVVKSNSHQIFTAGGADAENMSNTTSVASAGISRSNLAESQSERNSISNHFKLPRHNSIHHYRINDPYLSSQKTGDFDANEHERLHDSIRSGAIDLSISSDEDHRNMEFGPVGSNPRMIHLYQQQINQTPLPSNINTPTTVRRRSQNGNVHVVGQKFKNDRATASTVHDSSKRASISDVPPRTRSLCDSSDIQSRIDKGVASAMSALSDLSIDRDFPDLKSTGPNTQSLLCVHSALKTFCTICQSDSPPVVPHESVLTRMSAASTSSYTNPSTYNFRQSPRHSACEFRPQSGSPLLRRPCPPPPPPPPQHFTSATSHVGNNKISTHSNIHNNKIDSSVLKKEVFSRKVFVGGLPQDITETQIALEFKRFGELVVDWPHKLDSNSGLPPKGYAFLLFEQADSVVNLINRCTKVDDKFFWAVSSQRSESKQVQIRPWTLTDSIWSPRNTVEKPVPRCKRTVFVGGIPRQAQARELFENMNHCFGGVDLVEIDVDLEYSYPKGAASVTFDNNQCYLKALEAHFITLKLCGMEKRVEIKPFFSDDQNCEDCGIQMNSRIMSSSNPNNGNSNGSSNQPMGQYFCVDRDCLKYFCDNCWTSHQEEYGHMQPQQSKSNGYHRQFQFRRTTSHNGNYGNNKPAS